MKFKLPSIPEILCVIAVFAVICASLPPLVGQTYNVKNILGPEELQNVMDAIETAINGKLSASGTSTITGTVQTATNGYILVKTGTANTPVAGALAISGTNLYIGDGSNWLVK